MTNRPLSGITNALGMKLVLIPAGEFLMGSPEDEQYRRDDERQHLVRITKPFYLGVYEVTQREYEKVMGTNPSYFRGSKGFLGLFGRKENLQHPVEQVSWEDAVEFCRRLSGKEGKEYRLPTEAEWEYACRAGSTTRYSFGESESSLGEYAWYDGNSGMTTHPVGEKRPNGWGLYDMHGNVWEWCSDWYDDYGNSPTDDPQGPATGSRRVSLGGSWNDSAWRCRSAFRAGITPCLRAGHLGFRVALVPAE